jgi:GDSL-like Lipase/Acylhydrolase family
MTHLILLGDSIFDNGVYVGHGQAVIDQLQAAVPDGNATLLAQDGAVISEVLTQLSKVPSSASHLFISVGGNDALRSAWVLDRPASSVADALAQVEGVRDSFAASYRAMLAAAAELGLPTTVCTIYDSQLPDPMQRRISNLALGVLNDVITRQAVSRRLAVIDLRVMFDDTADYANAIEPSDQGGRKIASSMVRIVAEHDFKKEAAIYARG